MNEVGAMPGLTRPCRSMPDRRMMNLESLKNVCAASSADLNARALTDVCFIRM